MRASAAATKATSLEHLLVVSFKAVHVKAALKHFQAMNAEFQQGAWEEAIGNAGKFVEAVLKAVGLHANLSITLGRGFKAGNVLDLLEHKADKSYDDTVRITIPRACRWLYDIASNRGARHDPHEIDPNLMDARAAVAIAAWILAELVRYSQKGLDLAVVKDLVDGLTQRQYPLIEQVGKRVYFHLPKASARDVAVLSLWQCYPQRLTRAELVAAVMRHRFSKHNADVAVSRLAGLVDSEGSGGLLLLQPGIKEAELLMAGSKKPTPVRKRRKKRPSPEQS